MTDFERIHFFCELIFVGWVCPMIIGYIASRIYRHIKHKEE